MGKYKGHDTGDLRFSYLMTLKKDIDNNVYDEDAKVEVIDDPSAWAINMGMTFKASTEEKIVAGYKNAMRLGEKALIWLRTDKNGQQITSLVGLRAAMGVPQSTWQKWIDTHPDFAYMNEQIREIIAARIHEGGIRNKLNPIDCIFSLNNQYSEEFKYKQEVENTMTSEDVIQISGSRDENVKNAIEDNKKQQNE